MLDLTLKIIIGLMFVALPIVVGVALAIRVKKNAILRIQQFQEERITDMMSLQANRPEDERPYLSVNKDKKVLKLNTQKDKDYAI